ncbi:hypothetical protein Ddye_015182 [Dipteronia dyeriana]|uniref:RNase H type-1 domain-containing protein n=1 Tax=Dipteronia dyeriana TaxID=168575 RepID=A0AAD9U542_9ROSI|nr:hypothetical protein Ddye_015182 [Dipteronia dyeriana]
MSANFNLGTAKTMAIYKGIIFSKDCGLTPCVLESDAEMVVKRIAGGCPMDAISGTILTNIISMLDRSGISHIPKEANQVSFELAKNAMSIKEDLYWIEDFSGCIKPLIEAEKPR